MNEVREGEGQEGCSCKCHLGGAVSCPSCKSNHMDDETIQCEHCKKD